MGGQSVAFEFRTQDARLGRFLSTDPLTATTPWETPYAFAANSPVALIDWLGLKAGGPGDPPKQGESIKGDDGQPILDSNGKPILASGDGMAEVVANQKIAVDPLILDGAKPLRGSASIDVSGLSSNNSTGNSSAQIQKNFKIQQASFGSTLFRFGEGAVDGVKETVSFTWGLLPFTERKSWTELKNTGIGLYNISTSSASVGLDNLGVWSASEASKQQWIELKNAIDEIDFTDPYIYGYIGSQIFIGYKGIKFSRNFTHPNELVTMYRGASMAEIEMVKQTSTLVSPAVRDGLKVVSSEGLASRIAHTISSTHSPYVSITSSEWVAHWFGGANGAAMKFQIPRGKLYKSWFSLTPYELESLVPSGTKIHNLQIIK